MREFFHGWRRKMGAATLFMACVLTAGWVRSENTTDWLNCGFVIAGSIDSSVMLVVIRERPWSFPEYSTDLYDRIDAYVSLECKCRLMGFVYDDGMVQGEYWNLWTVPHWSIVLPLTLLSASLLLSKPRPKQKQPVTHA